MKLDLRTIVNLLVVLGLAAAPLILEWIDEPFYLNVFTRIVILAIAAVSLNLILGYGGMVSFGHAVYIGIGGYTVGVLAHHGIYSGFIHVPLAIGLSALFALIIGTICLRTRGLYFIMITLAFAQMVYFLGVGAYEYGGDDGLTIYNDSDFAGLIDLGDDMLFYYICFGFLLGALYLVHRIVNSRFGMVLQGSKSNDRRMQAIGFPTFRYRLTAFVIAGAICGLAGVLNANDADFISPSVMHWTRSGDLIIMVVLGGMGSLFGPVFGAIAFLLLEEVLSTYTEYWQIFFGPMLLLLVLFARGGIDGLLGRKEVRHA